jgi:hypothetical protein
MQTDPSARQIRLVRFSAPATRSVPRRPRPSCSSAQRTLAGGTTAPPLAMTSAGTQQRMTPLAHGQRPGHLRMLMPTHLGAVAVAAARRPAARVPPGCRPDRVRVGGSASPRLTAKLTAYRRDNRGPRRTALDGDRRPELRRYSRERPADQLTSPRVVEVPVAQRAPNCDVASAVAGIKIAWRPPMDSVAASGVTDSYRSDRPSGRWESRTVILDCGSGAAWMAPRTTCSRSAGSLSQRQGDPPTQTPDGMWRDSRRPLGAIHDPVEVWMARRELTAMEPLPTSNLHQHDRQRRPVRMLIDHRQART